MKIDLPFTFGLFHANIASLNLHIDDIKHILSRLNFNFDIIGICKHKIRKDTLPSNNISIPGYEEFLNPLNYSWWCYRLLHYSGGKC